MAKSKSQGVSVFLLTKHVSPLSCRPFKTACGKTHMFFRSPNFTHTDSMRTIGGRDYYRETRTHSAELSPNFV